jgi:hypothetical protein
MGKKKTKEGKESLNLKNREFCKIYTSPSAEFFGNGVESYAKAYNKDLAVKGAYNTCKVNASKLLTNTNILLYINELLETGGFNEEFADKQLLFVMTQNSDMRAKMTAIQEFNKIKQRITEKIELSEKVYKVGFGGNESE